MNNDKCPCSWECAVEAFYTVKIMKEVEVAVELQIGKEDGSENWSLQLNFQQWIK